MEALALGGSVALFVVVAHNLGLIPKVGEVLSQVLSCPRCSVFWGVLAVSLLYGLDPVASAVAAIGYAYLADWLGLPLGRLAILYEKLWKRTINRSARRKVR